MQDWLTRPAAAQGRAIAAGEIDARALTEAYLDAIAGHAQSETIYARTMADAARTAADAAAARARAGQPLSPLDGVPVSWKDLFDTAGTGTEAGSALLAGRVPATDAEVVRRGAAAGLVPLGKTHMSELAFSGLGINPVTATSPNPHGGALVPGGSSSGAAASVSFGLAAAAVGSDTGGSVRIPAAWHDLVGLKTTHGLIPLDGVVPLVPSLDTVGPLCRTLEDAALMHAILAETEIGAGATKPATDLTGARFIVDGGAMAEDLDPAFADAFTQAITRLEKAGARLETRSLDGPRAALAEAWTVGVEAYAVWGEAIEASPDAMFPMIKARFETGRGHDAVAYRRALLRLAAAQRLWLAETEGADAVLSLTTPGTAPETAPLLADEAAYIPANLRALRNTRVANMLGLSALTLPTGTAMAGLMLTAAPFAEERLLTLGAAAEAALAA